ncbi:MAG: acyloxyacyl hydrolase [Nitrospirae bacterium]|nr:MAG: acyloxyacyl hydrolase [Nitrospirota bacterium]
MKGAIMKRGWVFVVIGCLALFLPTNLQAESPSLEPQARRTVQRGALEIGFMAGYLQGNDTLTSVSSNRSALYALPRVGVVVTPEVGSGFYAGNLELLVEPLYAHYFKPFGATAAGGSVLFKYNFLGFGRWMPFWDLGLGMLWTNLAPRIPEQSTPFNFVMESGPGVQYFATERVALTLGVRFHHISNAGLGDRNKGLNSTLGYLGLSVFFPR